MKQSILYTIVILSILSISVISGVGCANIIPPEGGPRDTLPPRLVRAAPGDSTLNFRGNRIEFTFDEFVDLEQPQQKVLISPTLDPQMDVRLRTVTVRLRDTLESNTTYTINFGDALKDINEGNILQDFTYTFSTGPVFDTLGFSGNVVLAESGKVDTMIVAVLYRNPNDSAVINERPRYIARVDADGNFRFNNLPAGTFRVYAFGDGTSGSAATYRRYNRNQYFAFADSPIVVRPNTPSVTLYAYKSDTAGRQSGAAGQTPANDRGNGGTERRLRFTTSLDNNEQDLLKNLELTFVQPLRLYDSSRLRLTRDSSFTVVNYSGRLDSTRKRLTLQTQWTPSTNYHLILDRDFAEDTLGRRLLKSDTLSFMTRELTDYGRLRIRLTGADTAQNPVLQLLQNGTVVHSTSIRSGQMSIEQFTPGEYDVQVLLDRNNNGKWDPGQFFGTKRQPEIVRPVSRRITVRGGVNNEVDLSLE
jgi:uncharacterized protein (DUF2141 family)